MATIVTRSGKGSPLTHAEVDSNFTNLNTDKLELSGGTMTGNLSFGDNDKAIFGAGSDLQIYHDGSASYIDDQGEGPLKIKATDFRIKNAADTKNYLRADDGGAVSVYYDNSQKLATTATGVDITGTLTSDGLTVDGAVVFDSSAASANIVRIDGAVNQNTRLVFRENGTDKWNIGSDAAADFFNIYDSVNSTNRLTVENNGDISFYEDTGTTAKFFWDASAERLGLGTTSPSKEVSIKASGNQVGISIENTKTTNDDNYVIASVDASSGAHLGSSGDELQIINTHDGSPDVTGFAMLANDDVILAPSSGNVGIGTSSPSTTLNVNGTSSFGTTSWPTSTVGKSAGRSLVGNEGLSILWNEATAGAGNAGVLYIGAKSGAGASTMGYAALKGGTENATNLSSFFTVSTTNSTGTLSERLRIASDGSVGIGTTSPSDQLDISGSSPVIRLSDTTDSSYSRIEVYSSDLYLTADQGGTDSGNMIFRTNGTTERMRIDSSGNVGIGTSSPSSMLYVAGDAKFESGKIIINEVTGADAYSEIRKTNGGSNFAISSPESIYMLIDSNNDQTNRSFNVGHNSTGPSGSSTLFTVNESGNVGIGTSSPSEELDINANNATVRLDAASNAKFGNPTLQFLTNTGNVDYINFGDTDDADVGQIAYAHSADYMSFRTAATERMRIDSSGNLLVGRTTDANTNGLSLLSSGFFRASTTSTTTGVFNRNTSDGTILAFSKDGSTVGSIGTNGGDLTVGTGDVGLKFNDAVGLISPWDMTANAPEDNTIDLGYNNGRFKDLYLSGGIFLGGTGSANKLDDYEEGTFGASLDGASGGSITLKTASNTLSYIKIGSLVHIQGRIDVDSVSSPTGSIKLSLPFAAANPSEGSGESVGSVFVFGLASAVTTGFTIRCDKATSNAYIEAYDGTTNQVDATDVQANTGFRVGFSYRTSA